MTLLAVIVTVIVTVCVKESEGMEQHEYILTIVTKL